jgi:hypothetical protein
MTDNQFTEAKDELKQEVPEVVTRTLEIEGLVDIDKLVEEMEKIDKDQMENMDKMYALDVFYGGKRSNPYFTLCKLLQELNNKMN